MGVGCLGAGDRRRCDPTGPVVGGGGRDTVGRGGRGLAAEQVVGVARHQIGRRVLNLLVRHAPAQVEGVDCGHALWVDGGELAALAVVLIGRRPGGLLRIADGAVVALADDPAQPVEGALGGHPARRRRDRIARGVIRGGRLDARRIGHRDLAVELVVDMGGGALDAGPRIGLGEHVAELVVGRPAGERGDRGVARQRLGQLAPEQVEGVSGDVVQRTGHRRRQSSLAGARALVVGVGRGHVALGGRALT